MGIFDLFKSKPQKVQSQNDWEKMMEEDRIELEKLKKENVAWKTEFDALMDLKKAATDLEKSGKLSEAIEAYNNAVSFGEKSQRLQVTNYAHDIERLIILYGKTKQKETLMQFLSQLVAKYPNYPASKKWSERLTSQLQSKGKKV